MVAQAVFVVHQVYVVAQLVGDDLLPLGVLDLAHHSVVSAKTILDFLDSLVPGDLDSAGEYLVVSNDGRSGRLSCNLGVEDLELLPELADLFDQIIDSSELSDEGSAFFELLLLCRGELSSVH